MTMLREPTVISDCPEARERLQEYLDGELGEEALTEVADHLQECYPCGDRATFELHVREVVRSHATETAPAGLRERVRGRCFGEDPST